MDEMQYDNGELDTMVGGIYIPLYTYTQSIFPQGIQMNTRVKYNMATASWEQNSRTLFVYNVMNIRTQKIEQYWNFTLSIWVNSIKKAFTYTTANNIASQTLYTWDGAAWANYALITYTYDSMNKVTTSSYSNWNPFSIVYEPVSKDTIEYDASNNLVSDTKQTFNFGTSTWANDSKYIYANYLAPECFQTLITQSWNGSVFVNTHKDTILYNSYNQPTYSIGQTWTSSGLWDYDSSCSATHYYYELYSLPYGVESINSPSNSLELYPNPTSDIVYINFNTEDATHTNLSVLDMTGRTLGVIDEKNIKAGPNSIQYPVGNLSAGVYMIHLSSADGSNTKRFVVTH
jgi:hypothetical protein